MFHVKSDSLNSLNKRYTMFHIQSVSRTVRFIEQSKQAAYNVSRKV